MKPPRDSARAYRRLTWPMLRRRAVLVLVAVLVVTPFLALMFIAWDPPVPGPEVEGTLIAIHGSPTETKWTEKFLAQLKDRPEVVVTGVDDVEFREGARVLLRQHRSRFLGWRTYRFIRYLDDVPD